MFDELTSDSGFAEDVGGRLRREDLPRALVEQFKHAENFAEHVVIVRLMRIVGRDFERQAENVVAQDRLTYGVVQRGGEFGEQFKIQLLIADGLESLLVAIKYGGRTSQKVVKDHGARSRVGSAIDDADEILSVFVQSKSHLSRRIKLPCRYWSPCRGV